MITKPYHTVLLISILIFTHISCNENNNKEEKKSGNMTPEEVSVEDDSMELIDLENIPFKMPLDWVYFKNPIPSLPQIIAQAGNPKEPQTLLGITEYKVNSIEELMTLLIEDQKKINLEHTYTVKNDTLYTTTNYGKQVFLGKGIYGKANDKLRLIHVTSSEELFAQNLELINQVLSTVKFDTVD
ncbi:MAG: hypothetical protein AB8B59_06790 [Maribacter sp.]